MLKYVSLILVSLVLYVVYKRPNLLREKIAIVQQVVVAQGPADPVPKTQEGFNPDHYVISEYSKNALPAESRELGEIDIGEVQSQRSVLEQDSFALPEDYSDTGFADYTEVSKYDSGSGDITDLQEAYGLLDQRQYASNLKTLKLRGGNVFISPN